MKGNVLVILLIGTVIVLSLGAVGYLFIQNRQLQSQIVKTPPPVQNPTSVPAPVPVTDPTANWKTYISSELKVSLKYPSNIFVYQAGLLTDEAIPPHYSQYWATMNGGSPMEIAPDGVWMNLSAIKLNDANYRFYQGKTTPEKWTITHELPKPNTESSYTYYAIQLKGQTLYEFDIAAFTDEKLAKYKDVFDQILSTFKFL